MIYDDFLRRLNITQLKHIVKKYNLHTKIKVAKKTRDELIKELLKHTEFDDEQQTIIVKELDMGIIEKNDIPNYKSISDLNKLTTAVLEDLYKEYIKLNDTNMAENISKILGKREKGKKKTEKKNPYSKLSITELEKRIEDSEKMGDAFLISEYQKSLDMKKKFFSNLSVEDIKKRIEIKKKENDINEVKYLESTLKKKLKNKK
jgi:hypothetical protein